MRSTLVFTNAKAQTGIYVVNQTNTHIGITSKNPDNVNGTWGLLGLAALFRKKDNHAHFNTTINPNR